MKRLFIVVLVVIMVSGVGMMATAQTVEDDYPRFSLGVGYVAIPEMSGVLVEGYLRANRDVDLFFGLVPFDSQGLIIRSVGADYKFTIQEYPELRPGIGVIGVIGEGFSPTVSLTFQDLESPEIGFILRGGYNVVSVSAMFNF